MNLFLTMVGDLSIGSEANGFCAATANIWQIVGYVLLVFKIVIPVLLIILGMIDLGKAVVASKSDEVKKAATQLAFRAVAAVVIFLIPTIIGVILGFVSDFKDSKAQDDFKVCRACITRPNNDSCTQYVNSAWGNDDSTSNSSSSSSNK
jgi:hypothetical protein